MKRVFTTVLILAIFALSAQKRYDITLKDQGNARDAIISVPTKPMPVGGYPVVFMLHGTSGDSQVFYTAKGWKELGQEENFITVFPSSLKWCFLRMVSKKTIQNLFAVTLWIKSVKNKKTT
jgi:poly(3-hydroxybutyrate) depolymerase